mmetsp:Transcript_31036/g.87951  ORF Transcript_31036/g.87951 Transcript_31036/m.87951 type:complete len:112 (+) Transcript_31036:766-1101(+)
MVRAARKHRLFLCRNNGTSGGSGNGRYVVERTPPSWYEELLQAGALEGPLAREANVMHGGLASASSLRTDINSVLDAAGDDELDASFIEQTGGTEKADSREPYGGGTGKTS